MISEQIRTFFTSITLDANKNRIQQTWINHEQEFESVKICQIRKLEQKVQSRRATTFKMEHEQVQERTKTPKSTS